MVLSQRNQKEEESCTTIALQNIQIQTHSDLPSHLCLTSRSWLAQRDEVAVPWVSLTVHGHPDSLVAWGRQEHSFHTTGDNLYVLVITRERLHAYQLQGPAKPQRLYVKTNKNK